MESSEQVRTGLFQVLPSQVLPLEKNGLKSSLGKPMGQYYKGALSFGWLILGRQKGKHQKRPEDNLRPVKDRDGGKYHLALSQVPKWDLPSGLRENQGTGPA